MNHWTKQIKIENAALKAALDEALSALRSLGDSRLDKERICPWGGEGSIAYTTCAEEVSRIGRAVADTIQQGLDERISRGY